LIETSSVTGRRKAKCETDAFLLSLPLSPAIKRERNSDED
jgi:hypothetical protein